MRTLHFEKISKYDRHLEPVTTSLPFGAGKLSDPGDLVILDGEEAIPFQARPLARWPDGSIKWLLLRLQVDLPGNRDKELLFELGRRGENPKPDHEATARQSSGGVRVDTGALSFFVPSTGFLPLSDIRLRGKPLPASLFNGFLLRHDGKLLTSSGKVKLKVEEEGPLCVVISVTGKHFCEEDSSGIDLGGRITAHAGKTYVEVEHRFVHAREEQSMMLEELRLDFKAQPRGKARLALGEGYYRTVIREGSGPLERLIDGKTLQKEAWEHFVDSFYGDFWADWRDHEFGLAISIHQAHQNFPKKLAVSQQGISCGLVPPEVGSVRVLSGMAKTHRILLHFHEADTPLQEISARSLQFQMPDRPALSRQWMRENNPWGPDYFPKKIPAKLITRLTNVHDGRPKALGMLHFGDSPDSSYTDQGRGGGKVVWVNNEYDRAHACVLFYGLTGLRRALDSALVSARHWLDIDLCHHSDDPLIAGGLRIHSADHVTGGVTPSHEWVDGLLDYYYLTGRIEGLEAAKSVADNIMRHVSRPALRREGETSTRENGWALRAFVTMYLATGEERYRKEAKRIVGLFLSWFDRFGGLLAPYTDHSMPRVVFMNAITGNSLARYLMIEEDERVKALVVRIADELIEHCLGPDGVFYYKELPSLRLPHTSPHALELLAHAYRLTGRETYLKVATRQFAVLAERPPRVASGPKVLDPSGALISGHGNGRSFAYSYEPTIIYAAQATEKGLLDWYEYPF